MYVFYLNQALHKMHEQLWEQNLNPFPQETSLHKVSHANLCSPALWLLFLQYSSTKLNSFNRMSYKSLLCLKLGG